MRKIGLVGGLGPASTVEYYMGLNELFLNDPSITGYPEIVIDSVDMLRYTDALISKDYDTVAEYLLENLCNLKAAGAQIAAITANTEHIVWDRICGRLPLPTISVVDAVTEEIRKNQYKKVLVLATEWTLSSGLFEKPISQTGAIPVIPSCADQKIIGSLIYPNLENGIVLSEDKAKMIALIKKYIASEHPDSILLGCTELPLMIKEDDIELPLINSTQVHIKKIFQESIS